MRVIGLGWKDLRHPWSRDGKHFSALCLKMYLIHTTIPEQSKLEIPNVALAATLLSCASNIQLRTPARNLI